MWSFFKKSMWSYFKKSHYSSLKSLVRLFGYPFMLCECSIGDGVSRQLQGVQATVQTRMTFALPAITYPYLSIGLSTFLRAYSCGSGTSGGVRGSSLWEKSHLLNSQASFSLASDALVISYWVPFELNMNVSKFLA